MSTSEPGRSTSFSETLRDADDARLVALLGHRPDLASPAPSTLLSLVARASSRTSLERALVGLDALAIAVLEALVALDPVTGPVPPAQLVPALGLDDDPQGAGTVDRVLADLSAMALVWRPDLGGDGTGLRPAPGLAEVLGPFPAGLGPATDLPVGGAGQAHTDVDPLPADAPPGAAAVLGALAWGPPVGLAPRTDPGARRAVAWLVEHDLLRTTPDHHVVLPREVGLTLRHGRTHRDVRTTPPVPAARPVAAATADAESATSGLEVVRLVARLVSTWRENPPGALRSGGLGVRDLRRTAATLEVDDATAASVVELAAAAGLVADDHDDPAVLSPTPAAEDWLEDDLGARWAALARGWWGSRRTPWLVGSRDEKGALRAALHPDLWRPWVPRLRGSVLDVLAHAPGEGLAPTDVVAVLRWRTPRAVPPEQAVTGLLREAALLGVTGAGALSAPGRAVVVAAQGPTPGADPADPVASGDPASSFTSVLPPAVDDLLLQGDLTGIVPGRPSRALEQLLELAADVESRGAATTVRFTADSVVRALDHGRTADDLLGALDAHARTPVPQPLEYLVRDAARRHGRVRVGSASSYVRADDPTLLAGLAEAPALRSLGLVRIAPTVLVAAAPAAELQAALREQGIVSAVEGPDGRVLVAEDGRRRDASASRGRTVVGRRRAAAATNAAGELRGEDAGARQARHATLVARLRAADDAAAAGLPLPASPAAAAPSETGGAADPGGRADTASAAGRDRAASGRRAQADTGTSDPVGALGLLREAIADGSMVWLEVVGAGGTPARRRVRPLVLDAGRLRAQDPARDAELTVAVHRIASVTPDRG